MGVSDDVLRKLRDLTRPQPGSVSIDGMRKQDGVTRDSDAKT